MPIRYKLRNTETGKEAWTFDPLTWTGKGGRPFLKRSIISIHEKLRRSAARKQVEQESGGKRVKDYWARVRAVMETLPRELPLDALVVPVEGWWKQTEELEPVPLSEFLTKQAQKKPRKRKVTAPAQVARPSAPLPPPTPVKRIPGLTSSKAPRGLDLSTLDVCGRCFKVVGQVKRWHGSVWQGCSCRPSETVGLQSFKRQSGGTITLSSDKGPITVEVGPFADIWPGLDFNEVACRCYCCGTELLESGKKFSCWFCRECEARVSRVNQEWLAIIFPIGRHSFMNRVGIRGRDIPDQQKLDAFLERAGGLWDGQAKLYKWAPMIVQQNLQATGLESGENVALTAYLEACATIPQAKQEAFSRLLKFFRVEV